MQALLKLPDSSNESVSPQFTNTIYIETIPEAVQL